MPEVQERLWEDLLLAEIWEQVLDDRARRMLFRMTLLRRPWEPELNLVLGEPDEPEEQARETAERLRRTSLLEQVELWRATPEGPLERVRRYTLHPATVRFIRERFGEDEELTRAIHLRIGTFLEAHILEAQRQKLPSFIEILIEAGYHLLEGAESNRSFKLLGVASTWLQGRGSSRETLGVVEPFLAEAVFKTLKPKLAGQLLQISGVAHHRLGKIYKAIEYHEHALTISIKMGDRRGQGNHLGNLGLAYADLGKTGKAIEYFEQSLAIHREVGDRRGEGNGLGNLGMVYGRAREFEKAIELYKQALIIRREVGDQIGEGNDLMNLGSAHADLGKIKKDITYYKQAIAYYKQAIISKRQIGDRPGEGVVLGNLGSTYADLGETEKAIENLENALAIQREFGHRHDEGKALMNLGIIYAALGEVGKAIELLEPALRIGQEIKDVQIVSVASTLLKELRGS